MNVTTIGLDIAKSVFHLVGADTRGKQVLKKRLKRSQVMEYFVNLPPCVVGIEACGGAQYWARQLRGLGHEARLINAKYVKRFLRGNKNDYHDAAALCEAVVHPETPVVAVKTPEQQDLQALHRLRSGAIKQRSALVNRARGLLAEYGIVMPKGVGTFRGRVPQLLEEAENGLSGLFRELLAQLYAQVRALDELLVDYDKRLAHLARTDEACQRLDEVPGFGAVVATAMLATVGDGQAYRNGRHLSASFGLVPRQHGTGGKTRLLGISKRGDKYLRALVIHGARAVVHHAQHKDDPLSRWINRIRCESGTNVAAVALANKLVRIAWVILCRGERYRAALAARA
jgi:transposase